MMRPRFRRSLLPLFLASCVAVPAGPGLMEAALEAVKRGGVAPRDLAFVGWHQYLFEGDPAGARKSFQAAGNDPLGLAGQLDLARRESSPQLRAQAAVALARAGATSPLGRIGARALLDLVGTSPALDATLLAGAQGVLAHPTSAEVGFFCRLAVARIHELRHAEGWISEFAQAGALQELALAGPFAALRQLGFPIAYPPEQEGALRDVYTTPAGEVHTRALRFPTGDLGILGEPDRGDVYFLAGDLKVRGGSYVLFVQSAGPFTAFIDGVRVAARAPGSLDPLQTSHSLDLLAGPHRVLLKVPRADGSGLSAYLARADGLAEDLQCRAAHGAAPKVGAPPPPPVALPEVPSGAQDLAAALQPEVGAAVARYLAGRDLLARDLEGAKALLAEALPPPADGAPPGDGGSPSWTAPWLSLRAQLTLMDHSLPDRTGRAAAGLDLAAATARDPGELSAWLAWAEQAREEERLDDAEALLGRARGAPSPYLELAQARLLLARGLDPLADAAARRALALQPGLCEAAELRYDLARRNDSQEASDALAADLANCPDGLERTAELARSRADLATAEKAMAERSLRAPGNPRFAEELAQLQSAQRNYPEARRTLEAQVALWPRLAELHKRLAEVLTYAGDAAGALAEKRAALALDGSDLALRRQLALADGHDLLDDLAIDGSQAVAEYLRAPPEPGADRATAAYVLDMAGVEAFPDGTQVERIHTVAQVLDQRGIPQLAEQHLPGGAIALKLQTVKKDGRVLEPEAISDKESVSMPSVEVGDFVEVEYLSATPPRSLAEPGFASVPFYFRIADEPLVRSTFTFRGPPGVPLLVDAHHLAAPVPVKEGDRWVVRHEERHVPLLIAEPNAPSVDEYLPSMQVGTGAGVPEGLLPFADGLVGHEAPTIEVVAFAREAAGARLGLEAVQAVFAAVMERVKGEQNDITERASTTLAQERGSRLWLLKGALQALGIASHVALVRPLAATPEPYRFPNTDLFTYPILRVDLPGQAPLWLDPSVRFGPFDRLPEVIEGEREVAVLPAPGEALQLTHTPPGHPREPKQVTLSLKLSPSGDVEGEGSEAYTGYDAAILRQNLERIDDAQRKQAVEAALARSFQAATLEELTIREAPGVGAPLSFRYRFHSSHFARQDGPRLVLATPIFPAALGQRYVALATRTTPLMINGSEYTTTHIRIALPPGFKVSNPGQPAAITSPFGAFQRSSRIEGPVLAIEESVEVKQGRIAPGDYPDFVRFTAAVDQAEQQELDLEP